MAETGFCSVVGMFEEQVRAHSDKTAVAAGGSFLTYKELNEHANRIANALLSRGAGPEDVVMLIMPRIALYYAANIGVLKAGAAFTTLNPSVPNERLSYFLKDAGCRLHHAKRQHASCGCIIHL